MVLNGMNAEITQINSIACHRELNFNSLHCIQSSAHIKIFVGARADEFFGPDAWAACSDTFQICKTSIKQ